MPRPVDADKRRLLIDRAAAYLSTNGLTDTSLRDVAAALGTTSRMLVYYFGSKENFFSAAVESRRQDFRAVFDEVETRAGLMGALESLAREMADGEKESAARLLIQVLGAGASHDSAYQDYARMAIQDMSDALCEVLRRIGVERDSAAKHAGVIGAAFRGMLIDRFTSADADAVDEMAREMFAMLVDVATQTGPGGASS